MNLPKWQSHKVVEADKIVKITAKNVDGWEEWHLACGTVIAASPKLKARVPEGTSPLYGYFVRYADGFESWSPANAFMQGYTKLKV